MDISELWIPGIVFLIAFAMAGAFLLGRRVTNKVVRIPVRVTASAGMLCSSLLLALLIFDLYSCTGRVPAIYSPDGKHVAIVTYGLQGALGLDIAAVSVRSRWSPHARSVYTGAGDWGAPFGRRNDPEVRWIDNDHLMIRYRDYGRGYQQDCQQRVGDIQITCVRLPRPETK
jgi:hypothetical protein